MSIGSATSRNNYTGNGSTNVYNYTYRILDDDDLLVTVRNTSGVESTLVKGTDYSVTGVGLSAGGSITLIDANQSWLTGPGNLITNYVISIRRVRPLTQTTDIRNQGDFYPEAHEDAFDHNVMLAHQQQDELDRSLKLPETVPAADFDMTLPGDILDAANKVPLINPAGDGFADSADWPTGDNINSASASATAAAASATDAGQHATTASRWATKTDGSVVDADTGVDSLEYSSKAYALGGTGITNTAGKGAAKEWATKTGGTVDGTDYSAKYYAQAAAASASAAQWDDVSFKVFADSPITIVDGDAGVLFSIDCTGGNVAITLPQISTLTLTNPWSIGFKKTDSSANTITITRAGTDTFDGGGTSEVISYQNEGRILVPDTDSAPDQWARINFGDLSILNSPTINTPTTDVIIFNDQGSTPSTPASGFYKVYVKTDGRAYILSPAGIEAGLGGGGGGGSLKFVERGNSPNLEVENFLEVYKFGSGLAQELYAAIRVPHTYASGSPINLRGLIYNGDTSNNILMRTQSTLIRSEVDEVTSTANQRTSTNSAITMSSANDNEPQKVAFDLTSTTGQINSVSVSGGDLIIVRLYRDTDTATGDINFIHLATEVTFS
mgnify:CR=1 FL=1